MKETILASVRSFLNSRLGGLALVVTYAVERGRYSGLSTVGVNRPYGSELSATPAAISLAPPPSPASLCASSSPPRSLVVSRSSGRSTDCRLNFGARELSATEGIRPQRTVICVNTSAEASAPASFRADHQTRRWPCAETVEVFAATG